MIALIALLESTFGLAIEKLAVKAAISIFLLFGAYMAGIMHQRGQDHIAELRVELATKQQDIDIAARAATLAKQQAADLEVADTRNQGKINDLQDKLSHSTATSAVQSGCGPDVDFLNRLRDLK